MSNFITLILSLFMYSLKVHHGLGYKIDNGIIATTNGDENSNENLFEGDIIMVNPHNGIVGSRNKWLRNNKGLVVVPYIIQTNGYGENFELFQVICHNKIDYMYIFSFILTFLINSHK